MGDQPDTRLFGIVERRLFRATAVLFAVVAMVALLTTVVWALGQALSFFYNLVLPLAVAGVFALVLYPVVDHIERRSRVSRLFATSLVVLLFITAIVGVILMVLPTLVRQIGQFTEMAPGVLAGWQTYLSQRFPDLTRMVVESVEQGKLQELVPDMEGTGETLWSYVGAFAGLSFVPLILFFLLLSGHHLRRRTTDALSVFNTKAQQKIMYFIDVFVAQVTGFFQGQLVIAMTMGVMLATGFTLIGLKGGILVGLVLGLLNIVPFLGMLIGLLVVLPLAYFQPSGSLQLLGLSVLVFAVVQLVESWLLTPKIMANRSGLHPAVVVIAVFFWGTALGGITGMILAVPLTAFFIAVWGQAKTALRLSMTSDKDADRIRLLSDPPEP
ncbi:MAG: AI-2E family transporter [Gammaproteobacteria bacterium]|nr:AI-2E family transporter [Gammaproteobacteria bacterium]